MTNAANTHNLVGRDRRGRFAAMRPADCFENFTDEAEVTHTNARCANTTGELVRGGGGWLCTACVRVEVIPRRPVKQVHGAGGAKGQAIVELLAVGQLTSKQVAALVGCSVSRVSEVRSALRRPTAAAA